MRVPILSYLMSWDNYVVFTREAVPTEDVPVGLAERPVEALASLGPPMRVIASAHGHVHVFQGEKPDLERVAFPPESDWVVVGIDVNGGHHVAFPTRLQRPSTHARTWARLSEPAKRVVSKRWDELDRLVAGAPTVSA